MTTSTTFGSTGTGTFGTQTFRQKGNPEASVRRTQWDVETISPFFSRKGEVTTGLEEDPLGV